MLTLYRTVLFVHIAFGLVGLAAFWLPAVAKKGGDLHVQAGRVFFWCTCFIAATGLVMAASLLIDPLAVKPLTRAVTPERAASIARGIRTGSLFLFYLVLITFVPVYHGVRVLETRRTPERLRTPFHTFASLAAIAGSIVMVVLGIVARQPVPLFLSPIGFLIGLGQYGFARKPYATPMAWWYEHMGSMLGGGIAFHTAFLVLGAGRLLDIHFDGPAGTLPWILPSIIGIPATHVWTTYYRRKFKETTDRRVRLQPDLGARA